MEHDRKLPGECDARLARSCPPGDCQRPALQIRAFDRARQDDIGRLIERGPDADITDLGDVATAVGLAGLRLPISCELGAELDIHEAS